MVAQIDRRYMGTSPAKTAVRLASYALFEGRPLTTRGRWINPLVFANAAFMKRFGRETAPQAPIFIVGTGRSGTTVLGVVLSLHPALGFLNEPKALWHAAFPWEDLTGSYTAQAASYRLAAEQATPEVIQSMRRLYGGYMATVGARRVLDKYPELIFRVPFVRAIFPDARFLFLVRNGADTCRSVASWSARHGSSTPAETLDWWGRDDRKWTLMVEQLVRSDTLLGPLADTIAGFERQPDRAAVEWILTMREGRQLLRAHPDVVHEVRYEELVAAPVTTLRELLQFCDLDVDPLTLNYASATLQPGRRAGSPVDLHPELQPAFSATMRELGYAAHEDHPVEPV